jgi:hypothetical protein
MSAAGLVLESEKLRFANQTIPFLRNQDVQCIIDDLEKIVANLNLGGWLLTGNTVTSANFIGTLNPSPFKVLVGGANDYNCVGWLDHADGGPTSNQNILFTIYGASQAAFNSTLTGTRNVCIGYEAGEGMTSGTSNVYLGDSAGSGAGAGTASYNVALGAGSLGNIQSGTGHIAIGQNAGIGIYGTSYNIAIGYEALNGNNTAPSINGTSNIAIGYGAFGFNFALTNGANNIALGTNTGAGIVVGNSNIFIGNAAVATTDISNAVAIGTSASVSASNMFAIGGTGANALQVVVGGTAAAATAILDLESTTLGFLPPRMTTTQKNAIATPATGLVIFDSTLGKLCVFSSTWQTISST